MGKLGGLATCKPLQDGAYELRIAAFFLQEAVFASVNHVDEEAQDGPACEQHQRMRRQFGEDESAADEAQRSDDVYSRAAESTRMVRIEPTQDEDADAGAEEGENRTGTACFSDDVNRCETGDAGNDDADDDLDDIRRMELRMNLVKTHGHEAVTAHRVESPALSEEHAQDDRRQAADSARTDDGRTEMEADVFQDEGRRCCRIEHGIRDDAGHGRTDGDVQDRTDGQGRNDADRHVVFRILRFFGCRRQGIEAKVSEEENGRPGKDAVDAIRQERLPVHRFDMRCCQEEEEENRPDLDVHQDAVDVSAFADADDEERRRQDDDEDRRQINESAVSRYGRQGFRQVDAAGMKDTDEVGRPAASYGAGADRVFQNEAPADPPAKDFTERRIGVGVRTAGYGQERSQFRISKTDERAGNSGEDEG